MKDSRVRPVGAAAWTFFNRALMADEGSSDFVNLGESALDTFAKFLKHNAQDLAEELWQVVSRNAGLQTFLIRAPQIENSTLNTLFSKVILSPDVVMDTSIPYNRWALFANGDMVEYSNEIREFITDHAFPHLATYLIRRWKIACEQVDMSALPVSVALELTNAQVCSTAEYIEIWSGIPYDAYDTCEGVIAALARVCEHATQDRLLFPKVYLPTMLKLLSEKVSSKDHRVKILIHALSMGCSWSETAEVLPSLGEEYQALLQKRRVSFPVNDLDRKILDTLSARGFVGAVKPEANQIVVWTKRN
ncbi:hypothetical protein NS383_17735 [Pseudomonas oryzihabitans]|nr:hypothetical protein NS383_17735 [Pseudomonas psychrotolerans]